ncbi:25S rRNA (adenine645-N1)-methyltransferase [Irineochytrium annulatum]|nr:25S rRNA (adenine645-N1)-methyltransferase [Irineochytrium annulatum]
MAPLATASTVNVASGTAKPGGGARADAKSAAALKKSGKKGASPKGGNAGGNVKNDPLHAVKKNVQGGAVKKQNNATAAGNSSKEAKGVDLAKLKPSNAKKPAPAPTMKPGAAPPKLQPKKKTGKKAQNNADDYGVPVIPDLHDLMSQVTERLIEIKADQDANPSPMPSVKGGGRVLDLDDLLVAAKEQKKADVKPAAVRKAEGKAEGKGKANAKEQKADRKPHVAPKADGKAHAKEQKPAAKPDAGKKAENKAVAAQKANGKAEGKSLTAEKADVKPAAETKADNGEMASTEDNKPAKAVPATKPATKSPAPTPAAGKKGKRSMSNDDKVQASAPGSETKTAAPHPAKSPAGPLHAKSPVQPDAKSPAPDAKSPAAPMSVDAAEPVAQKDGKKKRRRKSKSVVREGDGDVAAAAVLAATFVSAPAADSAPVLRRGRSAAKGADATTEVEKKDVEQHAENRATGKRGRSPQKDSAEEAEESGMGKKGKRWRKAKADDVSAEKMEVEKKVGDVEKATVGKGAEEKKEDSADAMKVDAPALSEKTKDAGAGKKGRKGKRSRSAAKADEAAEAVMQEEKEGAQEAERPTAKPGRKRGKKAQEEKVEVEAASEPVVDASDKGELKVAAKPARKRGKKAQEDAKTEIPGLLDAGDMKEVDSGEQEAPKAKAGRTRGKKAKEEKAEVEKAAEVPKEEKEEDRVAKLVPKGRATRNKKSAIDESKTHVDGDDVAEVDHAKKAAATKDQPKRHSGPATIPLTPAMRLKLKEKLSGKKLTPQDVLKAATKAKKDSLKRLANNEKVVAADDDDDGKDDVVENDVEAIVELDGGDDEEGWEDDDGEDANVNEDDAGAPKLTTLQEKMKKKLAGGKFRMINEKLYTTESGEAFDMFKKQPELFDEYHVGFRAQVDSWPVNPVNHYIDEFKSRKPTGSPLVIADMGCGDAALADALLALNGADAEGSSKKKKRGKGGKAAAVGEQKFEVHSFDLVAKNPNVTACDVRDVPLEDGVVDVCVFSLSLMGTNFLEFVEEAWRILKNGGELKVAEVVSRMDDVDRVSTAIADVGFKFVKKANLSKMFILFEFTKLAKRGTKKSGAEVLLKPCIYKKR